MSRITRLLDSFRALPLVWRIGSSVALVAVVLISIHVLTRPAATTTTEVSGTPHVQLATVAALAANAGPLPVTGTVTSVDEATVLSQTAGEITTLSYALGDRVAAGTVIATFENSSQQAAVLQAQGAYDAAVAVAAKASGTTSDNGRASVFAALSSAAAAADDAIHARADQLFINARTSAPDLVITVPDSTLVATLKAERPTIETTLAQVHATASDTTADPDTTADALTSDLAGIRTFLDSLITAVNETPPSQQTSATTLSGYQTSLSAARTEVVAAISSVAAAKSAYDSNNIAGADAAVKQAQGALDAAKAALAKTQVVSPISGTIVALPVSQGDYVGAYASVATISNPHSLYIDTYVTSDDARSLSVGGTATVNGNLPGVITFIAPAVNPSTGKIEVKIGLPGGAGDLATGEVVNVSLARATHVVTPNATLTIPIASAKITPEGPVVFTVGTSSALVAHPITLGTILGDRVVVTSSLSSSLSIVTDARGLSAGEAVIVDAAP